VWIILLVFVGCSDPVKAKQVLEEQGYVNVQTTGCKFLACGTDDWYSTGFTATIPNGSTVSGTVCTGLIFKGSTVRF
jgi:hypothetical protein